MAKIGYNINLGGLRDQVKEAQSNAKVATAPFHLVMTAPANSINTQGDLEALDRWAEIVKPAQLVWRTYSKLESDWSIFPSNDEIVKRWVAENRPQYVRDDPSNEPSLGGTDRENNVRYVKSRTDLLRKAADAGIKVAVGAFSVGTPHESLIFDGTYDDLIRAVVEGEHYFSVHEYCPGIPGAGDVFPYQELLNPENILKVMKPNPWPIEAAYWLLRRSDRFVVRAREIGLSDPQIIITEAYIDLIPDANDVLNKLRDKYGIPAYNKDMRGVLGWRMYYADAFPEKSFPDVVTQLSKYVEDNVFYPKHIKGVCLFSLNWDWDTPEAHNFLNPSLDDFRRIGLANIDASVSILTPQELPPPSDTDTVSTRSPDFWTLLQARTETSSETGNLTEPGTVEAVLPQESDAIVEEKSTIEIPPQEPDVIVEEESAVDVSPVGVRDASDDVITAIGDSSSKVMRVGARGSSDEETLPSITASSTVELPAIALGTGKSRWQSGTFQSEGVRVRVAPFTDAEPIGLLVGEHTGQQHVGEIQSDGYTWRWVRYINDDTTIEGYAASAFYKFQA
jgi:hypothetical protein